ncbi:MAG: hypothetical protein HZA61_04940 [Candidatus Eisenbacteria bacterium]|uniref:Uncharacterized protein n=1 Tax=Eiseniibacteriota bacterium TaxID=2212470 RepID=A0A933SCL8_UNCEI|nr:hypothetical protein [Candidatus Eisenbacteria bacterium]
MSADRTSSRIPARRTARLVALAAFLVFALTGGGRISGSDEVTMFELSRAMLHGGIAVPEGATLAGPDGRSYSKNTAGQAVLALPLVAVGEAAAKAAGFREARAVLASRFVASFLNAFVTAVLLGAFYAFARRLGVRTREALAATALLGFTTPLWVYAKSFMAEPLEALGLLLTLGNAALAGAGGPQKLRDENRRTWFAALGAFLAVSAKASMLPLVLLSLGALGFKRWQRWIVPLLGVAAAIGGHLVYNFARFQDPLQSGYGAQQSAAAFSTPLLVGLYGLLLSSGKGLLWFAPAAWLAFAGFAEMTRSRQHSNEPRHGWPARRAAAAAIVTWAVALVQFGTFQHWGGDGSWGPRYLVPLLPSAFLAVAFALETATRARKRLAWALGLLGFVATLGGVGIHYGAEMRKVGDYPYTLPLEHPHFMEASHFNPRFSPLLVHWEMIGENAAAHLRNDMPRIGGEPAGAGASGASGAAESVTASSRLGISESDQTALLRAFDLWWMYARYAGIPSLPLNLAAIALLAASIWGGAAVFDSAARERTEA